MEAFTWCSVAPMRLRAEGGCGERTDPHRPSYKRRHVLCKTTHYVLSDFVGFFSGTRGFLRCLYFQTYLLKWQLRGPVVPTLHEGLSFFEGEVASVSSRLQHYEELSRNYPWLMHSSTTRAGVRSPPGGARAERSSPNPSRNAVRSLSSDRKRWSHPARASGVT
jgi:hypothetical protein